MAKDTTQLRARVQVEPVHQPVARVELESGISISVLASSLPMTIGRSASCDLSIPSGHVSRRHCELYLVNGMLCLKDTSSNGTMVNNRTIQQESVSIKGKTTIVFAGDVQIVISPAIDTEVLDQESRAEQERRREREDRRHDERREKSVVVSFERRTFDDRRGDDRRGGDRRAGR